MHRLQVDLAKDENPRASMPPFGNKGAGKKRWQVVAEVVDNALDQLDMESGGRHDRIVRRAAKSLAGISHKKKAYVCRIS